MSDIKVAFDFAKSVANALNRAGIKSENGDTFNAVLTVTGNKNDHHVPPVGCSINFDDKTGTWGVEVDMMHGMPCNEDSAPS